MPLNRRTNLKACWRKLQPRAALNKNMCVSLWSVCAGLASLEGGWAAEICLWLCVRTWWWWPYDCQVPPHRPLWDREVSLSADPSVPWPLLPEGMEYKLAPLRVTPATSG
ncbi:hypothetical protein Nmel_014198 [Mimus melanotis]